MKDWPELVGKTGEEAKEIIQQENPNLNIQVLPEGSPVTRDLRMDRVRIFVNENGQVTSPPRIG